MASLPDSPADGCFADLPLAARDVARGVTRMFFRQDLFALCEAPLPNGRRADMMAISAKGELTIVEIKVSRADLIGDRKWTDYLDYCDRFFWAVPAGFDLSPFEDGCRGGVGRVGPCIAGWAGRAGRSISCTMAWPRRSCRA
jgi:hypothetical protein